jgi:hypothetical protein
VSGRRKPSAKELRRAEIEANNLRVSARYVPEPMRVDIETTERVRRASEAIAEQRPGVSPAEVLRQAVDIGISQIEQAAKQPEAATTAEEEEYEVVVVQSADLARLEQIISDGMRTFVDVGRALARIRDEKLYQETHATFEAYCRERWEFTRSYAHRLIGAAGVVANWQHELPPPANEAQARELAKLPAEQQAEAWAEVVEAAPAGAVTAKLVADVVAKRLPPAKAKPKAKEPPYSPPAAAPTDFVGLVRSARTGLHGVIVAATQLADPGQREVAIEKLTEALLALDACATAVQPTAYPEAAE